MLFNCVLWSCDRVITGSPFQNRSANPGKEKHYGEETHGNCAIFLEKEQEMEYIAVCLAGGVNCSLAISGLLWRGSAPRLLLGEAVATIGTSEPIVVTDEGDPAPPFR